MDNQYSSLIRVTWGVMALALFPTPALAQVTPPDDQPPPAPAATPEVTPEAPETPPAPRPEAPATLPPPPTAVAPEAPAALPAPPTPAAAEPAAQVKEETKAEESLFKITTGVGFRGSVSFQNPEQPNKFNDVFLDLLNVELRFNGQINEFIGWTANLTVDGRSPTSVTSGDFSMRFQAQALDLIAQLDPTDEFHVWLGRMLTPADRSNFSGAWFMSPFNYPGVYHPAYIGPRGSEENGREVGAVAWGNDKSGKFKYYLGVMDLDNPELTPLYAGRIGYAFIGSEPGYYGSSTYYGAQDIVALGLSGRYQKRSRVHDDEDPTSDDRLYEVSADLLAEFDFPGTGTFTLEGTYHYFNSPISPVKNAWFGVFSYLTPEPIGVGKVQLLARYQKAYSPDVSAMDFWASYVIKDYFAKIQLGYTRADLGDGPKSNALQLAVQLQQ